MDDDTNYSRNMTSTERKEDSVSRAALMYRHVLQQVGLLSECFGTMLTPKWFLARMSA